jgi:aminopeptidase N
VRPTHYVVRIEPHAEQLRFDGHISIMLKVLAATDRITLNKIKIDFYDVRLQSVAQGARKL